MPVAHRKTVDIRLINQDSRSSMTIRDTLIIAPGQDAKPEHPKEVAKLMAQAQANGYVFKSSAIAEGMAVVTDNSVYPTCLTYGNAIFESILNNSETWIVMGDRCSDADGSFEFDTIKVTASDENIADACQKLLDNGAWSRIHGYVPERFYKPIEFVKLQEVEANPAPIKYRCEVVQTITERHKVEVESSDPEDVPRLAEEIAERVFGGQHASTFSFESKVII